MNTRRERNKAQKQDNLPTAANPKGKDENQVELGKYFYTLSHLVFGGVVLAILLDFNDRKFLSLVYGLLATAFFASIGWMLIRKGNLKK